VIDRLKRHPLARAVRLDKVRIAGLEITLGHYIKEEALVKIPVWKMLSAPLSQIERRAGSWADALGDTAHVIDGETMIGGGSMPAGAIPTKLVAIGGPGNGQTQKYAQMVSRQLRLSAPPIIGRIDNGLVLLDPRTVLPEEDEIVLRALHTLCLS